MSKISSKLSAGVRKVKTEQRADKPATTPVAASAPAEKTPKGSQSRPVQARELHPARVWPD